MKYIVGFSGGVDSQAAANWAIDTHGADNVVLLNSDPGGNEHPITTEFLQWFSTNVHPVMTCRPIFADFYNKRETVIAKGYDPDAPITFADLAKWKGRFPGRMSQFCTEFLKLRPALRWCDEHMAGVPYTRVSGLRRDESRKRALTPFATFDTWFQCELLHPLADKTKSWCFDYCHDKGQQTNLLYRLGFSRVGCAPCINAGRDDIRLWATRFPEMIEKVRGWERQVGRTFFPPMVPGLELNWINQVVAWAMEVPRSRGQLALDVLYTPPVCESAYGLCE